MKPAAKHAATNVRFCLAGAFTSRLECASEVAKPKPVAVPRAPEPDSPGPRPEHERVPPKEPTKDAPSFPPGSPENVPPGPTSA